ncbi:Diphthine synthase [Candidatus Nitrosotalea sp. TS]|uniref:SAM-dependent methyltransferase n=1 Tax=Candidatus Nitrosotalea sp. TS TaxID=2341020 RepID=UPI001ECC465B|nr:SAM-dependent methyltransferase [Candidatus Nitrosotalea sp. TS]NHI03499.1 Diphthine synthase [Candidatus Nitrosotalea sp. TS]
MLWFIGLGIAGIDGVGQDTIKILKKADLVFFENFTSPIPKSDQSKIKKLVKSRFRVAPRWLVEDGKTILAEAKKKTVVLLAYGDPYIATTHIELRTRAETEKIKSQDDTCSVCNTIPCWRVRTTILQNWTPRHCNERAKVLEHRIPYHIREPCKGHT